jgi:hypothetical protein
VKKRNVCRKKKNVCGKQKRRLGGMNENANLEKSRRS